LRDRALGRPSRHAQRLAHDFHPWVEMVSRHVRREPPALNADMSLGGDDLRCLGMSAVSRLVVYGSLLRLSDSRIDIVPIDIVIASQGFSFGWLVRATADHEREQA
jgi:hypothetical protein